MNEDEKQPPQLRLAISHPEGNDSDESGFQSDSSSPSTQHIQSAVESILFATDRPMSINLIKQAFGENTISTAEIKEAIMALRQRYEASGSGICLVEVSNAYQLRTKAENAQYLQSITKKKPFRLSGPAMETLGIVAYKQPITKHEIDEIRGVESGHLLRSLMERGIVVFAGKSELPGKPMQYATTKKFLEIFGLRNLNELPSLAEIDELIPEGIGEVEKEDEQLDVVSENLANPIGQSYSEEEEELELINERLSKIETTSQFFEDEKQRQRQQREAQRAEGIREALVMAEEVSEKDRKWLERYDQKKIEEDEKKVDEDQKQLAEDQQQLQQDRESMQEKTALKPPEPQSVNFRIDDLIEKEDNSSGSKKDKKETLSGSSGDLGLDSAQEMSFIESPPNYAGAESAGEPRDSADTQCLEKALKEFYDDKSTES